MLIVSLILDQLLLFDNLLSQKIFRLLKNDYINSPSSDLAGCLLLSVLRDTPNPFGFIYREGL